MTSTAELELAAGQGIKHRPDCTDHDTHRIADRHFATCVVCVACGRFRPIETAKPAKPPAMIRWSLACIDCGAELHPTTGRPQLPVCAGCQQRRRQ